MPIGDEDRRTTSELFWMAQYYFLLNRGYKLRPRYHPDWVPSWVLDKTKIRFLSEDNFYVIYADCVMDAVSVSDNKKVVLKKVDTKTNEIPLLSYLSHSDRRNDPRNHSAILLDIIPLPTDDNTALIVLPFLMRIDALPFRRVGEIGEALEQLLEGVAFLHEHDIMHGDACFGNFMVDGGKMVPGGWHFADPHFQDDGKTDVIWKERWKTRPNRYYLIDFNLSSKVDKDDEGCWLVGDWGQDRTVPEMSHTEPCDGFKVDVYQMGNIMKRLIQEYSGLECFKPIADKLTAKDPNRRPSAASAVHLIRYFNAKQPKSVRGSRIWNTGLYGLDWKGRFQVQFMGQQLHY